MDKNESPQERKSDEDDERKQRFYGITSWRELSDVFDKEKTYMQSGKLYTRENLREGIEVVLESKFINFQFIPSTEGLRKTVAKLCIQRAESYEELLSILDQVSFIDGDKKRYKKKELVKIVQAVFNQKETPIILTKAYGLRATVEKLQKKVT